MKNKLKKLLVLCGIMIVLLFQISVCNSRHVYASPNNKVVQKQNKVVQKKENSLTKRKLGIGAGIVLIVLIVGRAITPKEAFK